MKTNSLIYKCNRIAPNGEQWEIKIRLDDQCKNGHQDFSITGTAWGKGKAKTDRNMIHGGACGDEIATLWPEFEIFNRLHLCDCKGRPMYAAENGRYHFTNTSFEVGRDYLRLTTEEAKELSPYTSEKETFQYHLEKLGILERWESEANEAIKLLESLTGDKFVDDSKRYQYEPLNEERREMCEKREKAGFYKPEAIQRREDFVKDEEDKKIVAREMQKITELRNFASAKEKAIKAMLAAGFSLKNVLFVDANRNCIFNIHSYEKQIDITVLEAFISATKIDGFTFKIETKK